MGGILKILASFHSMANFDFDYILIRDSDFSNGALYNCTLGDSTRVHATNFKNTSLENCVFRGSRFSGCNFNSSYWGMVNSYCSLFEDCLFINVRFSNCDLRSTHFKNCIFHRCFFFDCNLDETQFYDASSIVASSFRRCDFNQTFLPRVFIPVSIDDSKNVPYIPMVCPDEGEFIGYKKAWAVDNDLSYAVIITLRIPADARRSSGLGRKCRCDKATVVKMEWLHPEAHPLHPNVPMARSIHDEHFIYTEGKLVEPRNGFCEDRWDVCSKGIHFFMNKQEAIDY